MMSQVSQKHALARCVVIVIGRNEGQRLTLALEQLKRIGCPVVYVDSDSSDSSVEDALAMDIPVLELDSSQGLSAAKARNAGARWASEVYPEVEFFQFIDGDCLIDAEWLPRAISAMDGPDIVGVCGRCQEMYPEASIYNKLCDMEWDGPVGLIEATGGNVMIRRSSFERIGGFDPTLVAGEEPELCFRLRSQGGSILRIDAKMVLHDADMHHFSQWWKRCLRGGYADAASQWKHRGRPGHFRRRAVLSTLLWGLFIPCFIIILSLVTAGIGVVLLVFYPLLGYRIRRRMRARGIEKKAAMLYALACVLSKFSGVLGIALYHWRRISGQRPKLIEHKQSPIREEGR